MRVAAWIGVAMAAVAGALGAAGCRREAPSTPVVVVSVLPQAYFVERIAGDLVDVEVMIPPGASPATYEPTMEQMRAASDASVYVKVGHPGFPFERAWLDRLVGGRTRVVDGSAGVARLEGDPHVWVAPANVRTMAANIERALAEVVPEHRATLEANLAAFEGDIDALDAELRGLLAPHRGERFFVFHPAWGYLAEEYGLVQVAVEHEHKSPSPAHLAEMIEEAREAGARVVFVQPQFPRTSAELIAREIGATVVTADPLARDWLANTREVGRRLAEALDE